MALFNLGGVQLTPAQLTQLLALLDASGGGGAITPDNIGNGLSWSETAQKLSALFSSSQFRFDSSGRSTIRDGAITSGLIAGGAIHAGHLSENIDASDLGFNADETDGYHVYEMFRSLNNSNNIRVSDKVDDKHSESMADFTTLSDALSYTETEGGDWTIFVDGGSYELPSDATILNQSIRIVGSGRGVTTLTYPSVAPTGCCLSVGKTSAASVAMVSIEDASVTYGNKAVIKTDASTNQAGSEYIFRKCSLTATEASSYIVNAMSVTYRNSVYVESCDIDHDGNATCALQASSSSVNTSFYVRNSSVEGYLSDTTEWIQNFENIYIDGSYFNNIKRLALNTAGHGYIINSHMVGMSNLTNAYAVRVVNNYFEDCRSYASDKYFTKAKMVVGNVLDVITHTSSNDTDITFSQGPLVATGNCVTGCRRCFDSPSGAVAGNYFVNNATTENCFVYRPSLALLSGNRAVCKYHLYEPNVVYVSGDYASDSGFVYLSSSSRVYASGCGFTSCIKFLGAGGNAAVVEIKGCTIYNQTSVQWFANTTAIDKFVMDNIDVNTESWGGGDVDILNFDGYVNNVEMYNCRLPDHCSDITIGGITSLKAMNVNLAFSDTGITASHCEEYTYG